MRLSFFYALPASVTGVFYTLHLFETGVQLVVNMFHVAQRIFQKHHLFNIFPALPDSVIGNTPDSGSGKSRFDP
jgi:hypothetical protein